MRYAVSMLRKGGERVRYGKKWGGEFLVLLLEGKLVLNFTEILLFDKLDECGVER